MNTKIFRITTVLLLLSLVFSCKDTGTRRVIKLGHGLGVSHPVHGAMLFLAEKVAEKSNGELTIKVYPNQQLGTERELVELLQIGSIGMTKVSSAVLEGFAPTMAVFGMPYLFRDDEHQRKVLEGPIGKKLLLDAEEFWLRGLCYYDAGKRSFYTKNKPVEKPSDLRGMKIRVMESNTATNMVKSFGSSPTPVSYGELYSALQQGIVDGAENNPPSLFTSKHYEVCGYYSINEHTALPDVMIVSTKVWESLSGQEKEWLQSAADESAAYEFEIWAKATEESLQAMEAAGVTITYPDKESFRESVESLYTQLRTEQPALYKIVEEIRAVN